MHSDQFQPMLFSKQHKSIHWSFWSVRVQRYFGWCSRSFLSWLRVTSFLLWFGRFWWLRCLISCLLMCVLRMMAFHGWGVRWRQKQWAWSWQGWTQFFRRETESKIKWALFKVLEHIKSYHRFKTSLCSWQYLLNFSHMPGDDTAGILGGCGQQSPHSNSWHWIPYCRRTKSGLTADQPAKKQNCQYGIEKETRYKRTARENHINTFFHDQKCVMRITSGNNFHISGQTRGNTCKCHIHYTTRRLLGNNGLNKEWTQPLWSEILQIAALINLLCTHYYVCIVDREAQQSS